MHPIANHTDDNNSYYIFDDVIRCRYNHTSVLILHKSYCKSLMNIN